MREQRRAVEDRDVGAADADLRRRPDDRRVCLGEGGDARAEGHGDPHARHRKRGERVRIVGQLRRRRAVHRQALHAGRDAEGGLHGSIASQCANETERHDGAPDVHAAHVGGNVGARTETACRHAHADAVGPAPRRRQLGRPERGRIAEVRHPSDAERHGDTRARRRRRREGFGWPRDGRRRPQAREVGADQLDALDRQPRRGPIDVAALDRHPADGRRSGHATRYPDRHAA